MNWNQTQSKWNEVTSKLRQTWGKFTDDELNAIAGKREVLVRQIQEKYGIAREIAEKQVEDFESKHIFQSAND